MTITLLPSELNKVKPLPEPREDTPEPEEPVYDNSLEGGGFEGVTIQDDMLRLNIQLRSSHIDAAKLAGVAYSLFNDVLILRKDHELKKRSNGYT